MPRARASLIVSAALVVLALFAAPIAITPALSDEDNVSTTIADDTYGEGGTKQSLSNGKHELLGEVWRDKNGVVREQFEVAAAASSSGASSTATARASPRNGARA